MATYGNGDGQSNASSQGEVKPFGSSRSLAQRLPWSVFHGASSMERRPAAGRRNIRRRGCRTDHGGGTPPLQEMPPREATRSRAGAAGRPPWRHSAAHDRRIMAALGIHHNPTTSRDAQRFCRTGPIFLAYCLLRIVLRMAAKGISDWKCRPCFLRRSYLR
jgi:hypothetical protein